MSLGFALGEGKEKKKKKKKKESGFLKAEFAIQFFTFSKPKSLMHFVISYNQLFVNWVLSSMLT